MTDRLADTLALGVLLAVAWLMFTRLGFVLSPAACWTTC